MVLLKGALRHAAAALGIAAVVFASFFGSISGSRDAYGISLSGARTWNAVYGYGAAAMAVAPGRATLTDIGHTESRTPESPDIPAETTATPERDASTELRSFELDVPPVKFETKDSTGFANVETGLREPLPPTMEGDDSLGILADSTARKRFLPEPGRPGPVARPFPERSSPIYLRPSQGLGTQRVVRVDSTRNVVVIREVLNGRDVSIPYEMPLDEYIKRRYEFERDRRTADFTGKRAVKTGDALDGLLRSLTEFDIPVPPNPLMSIFGDRNRISLRISGAIDINAGFRIEKSDQQSVFMRQTQFSPNFRQQVNVNVNGLIGDKLNIRADWSTERTFEYENQLKIRYTGYDDEIIQSIEAGNVSLQTPSQLVGGSGALFGIRADLKFGPLRLSAVASQKKGESNRLSIAGGATEQTFERRAYEYAENHYFVSLDYREPNPALQGRNVYEAYYNHRAENSTMPVRLRPDLEIRDMEVWTTRPASAGVVTDPEERAGVAFIDLTGFTYHASDASYSDSIRKYTDPAVKVESQSGLVEAGNFKKMKRDIDYSYNPVTGILTMNQNVQEDQVIAVAYRVAGANNQALGDLFYGTFVNDPRFLNSGPEPRLVLKLVKPKNLSPSFSAAWKHRVRSIYSLNMRNLKKEDLANFRLVFRQGGAPDNENLPGTTYNLLRLFGLDYTDDNGTGQADRKIDFIAGITVDPIRGEIIFPTLEPWNSGLKYLWSKLPNVNPNEIDQYLYPEIYDTTKTIARQSQQDKILIVGTTRGSSSSTYYLGFNVVPGSVRVRLNNTPLVSGVDYTVDEQAGQVRILKAEALEPGAKLDIDFEKQDLFSFASKTLVGIRGDLELGAETFLGFTLLSLNQKTLSDKVRIGEEPISNTMFGVDLRTKLDLPFVTEALNTLPFLQTREKSSLTLQGEAAVILPDPNTKYSSIPSDQGKGIAYIDDFEGARVYIPLQTAYSAWKISSVPKFLPTFNAPDDSTMHSRRGRMKWYNVSIASPSNRTVIVTDIWPNRLAAREDQRVTVLDIEYDPARHGMFNYTPTLSPPDQTWNGLMRLLPVNATNLVDGNYNYIELWMKVETQNPRGKLLIDLGKVTEDVIPDGQLNSEDLVIPGSIRNGILNEGEDVGIDMLTDDQERERYGAEIALYGLDPADPSGDNYTYDVSNYDRINGTEGNFVDAAGQFPDTEDLNNNGILDLSSDYYQYEIDLDTTRFSPLLPASQRNPYVVGGGANGWYQFRIPLSAVSQVVGTPSLDNVEYVRVLFTGMDGASTVRVAEFNFVGNQWYERLRNDTLFTVSVVNIEDNPEYTSPPGVVRERDRRRPDQEVYMNEQSLSLDFRSLPDTTLREAYRLFPATGVDMFNYESLKMFVHGHPELDTADYEVVMRFGIDTLNFYEYRAPIHKGWASENEVSIRFADVTAVKTLRDTCSIIAEAPVPDGPPGSYFRVVGCPDVVSVRFISVGVRNKHRDNRPISGVVYINELRVVGPNKNKGYAYTGSMNLRLADVADINATVNHTDPYFHNIAERFSATRASTTSWTLNTTLNLDKVFPKDWQGTQLRVSYSHSEALAKPLLLPGQPDVDVEGSLRILAEDLRRKGLPQREIDDAVSNARSATHTMEIRDSWSIPSVRIKAPGKHWLIEDVLNRLDLGYNYTVSRFRDPVIQFRRSWQWQARAGYGYDISRDLNVQPFKSLFDGVFLLEFYKDAKYFFLPQRIGLNADLARTRIEEQRRDPPEYRPYIRDFTHNRSINLPFTISEQAFLNLNGNYTASLQTSLLHFETDYELDEYGNRVMDAFGAYVVKQRQSSAIFSDIFFGRGSLNFGLPIRYTQQFTLNSRPQLPRYFDIDRLFDMSGGYNVSYTWQENLQQLGLGRQASFNASINWQVNFRLKQLFDPLFAPPSAAGAGPSEGPRSVAKRRPDERRIDDSKRDLVRRQQELETTGRELKEKNPEEYRRIVEQLERSRQQLEALTGVSMRDSAAQGAVSDSAETARPGPGIGEILQKIAYYAIKVPLLDYENINFTFSENNTSNVSGVRGLTGFSVFWATNPFTGPDNPDLGPSRLYQLGLVTDPNPGAGSLGFRRAFPFVGIDDYRRGLRAANPNGAYVDNFSQNNTISVRTNRPLWEGARVDFNWDLRWSLNRNYQLQTDDQGFQTITNLTSTGQMERSFLAFPDFLFFSFFNTNIEAVNERYKELLDDPDDKRNSSEKLAEAFETGFEAVPWLTRVFGGWLPRVNWSLRWDGIEKISIISGLADRISLEHRYSSTLTESFRNNPSDGVRITESKRVGFNFAPLVGLTFNFNKLWGGDLTLNTRWGKQKNFDLNTSANNVVEQSTDEISITAGFRKTGFDLPLFGLSLKNDIDFNLSFTLNKTSSYVYEVAKLDEGGQPREGTTRITLEPRVRYTLSQRVQSSLFYRFQSTKPDSSVGSRVPGTTIHEGGLELRISITGS